jgi:hypothetical protein
MATIFNIDVSGNVTATTYQGIGASPSGGYLSIVMTDANLIPTTTQLQSKFLNFTGALTATRTITLDLMAGGEHIVNNSTSGGHSLIFEGPSGTGPTVTNGSIQLIACDGTNWYAVP